jgi:hypothetical protein
MKKQSGQTRKNSVKSNYPKHSYTYTGLIEKMGKSSHTNMALYMRRTECFVTWAPFSLVYGYWHMSLLSSMRMNLIKSKEPWLSHVGMPNNLLSVSL